MRRPNVALRLPSAALRLPSAALALAFAGAALLFAGSCGLDPKGSQIGLASSVATGAGGGGTGGSAEGSGGHGGSVDLLCFPEAAIDCYEGEEGTEDVGVCKGGQKTCAADGLSYGVCSGQIIPTPEDCVSLDDEDCDGETPACVGDPVWARRMGGTDYETAVGVAVDPNDNVIVTGLYKSAASFGSTPLISKGDYDIFIAKYSADNTLLWDKSFGGVEADQGLGVATDGEGNIFVTGRFRNTVDFGFGQFKSAGGEDVFLLKLDPFGNMMFAKHFGVDGDQFASGVAVASDGGPVITGSFTGSVSFDTGAPTFTSAGNYDIFVAKFLPDGQYDWARQIGDVQQQAASAVATGPKGQIIIAGQANGKFNVGNVEVTTQNDDAFVVAYDINGTALYARVFGDIVDQALTAIALDAQGRAVIVGDFHGKITLDKELTAEGFDSFVAALDEQGNPLWSRRFGGLGGEHHLRGVAVDPFGNVLVSGFSNNIVSFDPGPLTSATRDVFVAKLSPTGEAVWGKLYGDDASWEQYGIRVAADSKGSVLVCGEFESTINFPNAPITSVGGRDAFVAKLAP